MSFETLKRDSFLLSLTQQEPYVIAKLDSAQRTYKELTVSHSFLEGNRIREMFDVWSMFVLSFWCLHTVARHLHMKILNMLMSSFQTRLADPDVAGDPSEYMKIAKSAAEIEEVRKEKGEGRLPSMLPSQ